MDGADRHTPLSGFFFFVLYMNVGRWDIYLGGTGWDRQRTMEALDDGIGDFGCRRLEVMMKEGLVGLWKNCGRRTGEQAVDEEF